jgi:hypothetical protein
MWNCQSDGNSICNLRKNYATFHRGCAILHFCQQSREADHFLSFPATAISACFFVIPVDSNHTNRGEMISQDFNLYIPNN